MTPEEQQLVQIIAREVMRQLALQQQAVTTGGQADASAGVLASGNVRAEVRPPIGGCTGDYSKFPELAERLNPPRQTPQAGTKAGEVPAGVGPLPAMSALTGFVTENQLREAIKSSANGVAILSASAKLTPLANDFARQFPQKIQRLTPSASIAITASTPGATASTMLPWQWWIQGQCPVVQRVVSERASSLRTTALGHDAGSLPGVVRELASAVRSGQASGGLLFVPTAARAVCLANRCQSLRAIVGTCGQAVEQGIRELGANVLVIEYPHHGPRSVAGMVDRFISQRPDVPAAVQRELADLHRCG